MAPFSSHTCSPCITVAATWFLRASSLTHRSRTTPSPVAIAERAGQPPQPERRVPLRVIGEDRREGAELLSRAVLRVDHRTRHLQMLVHRLARHEQMHDLARPLEDEVDAHVPHDALD